MSLNQQIYEEATSWVLKHRESGLDPSERKSFDEWLRTSPQHVRAYLEMSSIWEDVSSLDRRWNPDADELLARARAEDSVVALGTKAHSGAPVSIAPGGKAPIPKQTSARSTPEKGPRRIWFAVAATALLVLAGTWTHLQQGTYVTAIGEQRSLALPDGSTVELNSQTHIKVRYGDGARRIDLLAGQALFRVAKDVTRPFVVQTDTTRIRAVGTAFDVYKTKRGAVVTVVEGRVAVLSVPTRAAPASPASDMEAPEVDVKSPQAQPIEGLSESPDIMLNAGEQLVVTLGAAQLPKLANVATATAWMHRSLVFEASPLTEVADEFNRYNTRRLVVESPELAGFNVSGVFSSVEPGLLLAFLRAQPELVVRETDSEIRIRKR